MKLHGYRSCDYVLSVIAGNELRMVTSTLLQLITEREMNMKNLDTSSDAYSLVSRLMLDIKVAQLASRIGAENWPSETRKID